MQSADTQTTPEASQDVSSQYRERFNHPPAPYCRPFRAVGRLTPDQRLELMQKALATGEPVPTWAEQEAERQAVLATNGRVV